MANPVAAGVSRINLLNLSRDEVVESSLVLELYDGTHRLQVSFESEQELRNVAARQPASMMNYFRDNLFESPEMADPIKALLAMAHTAGQEGLVTVPPEDEDEELFDLMTDVFQNAAEYHGNERSDAGDGDFLQSLLRERNPGKDSP